MRIVMLCGPPGAGKSTYVSLHRSPGDCQVDMDLIPTSYPQPERLAIRKALLLRASLSPSKGVCWFQTAAPRSSQRQYWRGFVPISRTMIFVPPQHEVLQRQRLRDGPDSPLSKGVQKWYESYDPPTIQEPHTLLIQSIEAYAALP